MTFSIIYQSTVLHSRLHSDLHVTNDLPISLAYWKRRLDG